MAQMIPASKTTEGLLRRFRTDNSLYPIVKRVEQKNSVKSTESIVSKVILNVLDTARKLWVRGEQQQKSLDERVEIVNNKNYNAISVSDISKYQDMTNLFIVSLSPNFPLADPVRCALEVGTAYRGISVLASDFKASFDIDLSQVADKASFTDLPSDLLLASISKLDLQGIDLFQVPKSLNVHRKISSLNMSNTKLETLTLQNTEATVLPSGLKYLNISNNPSLKSIDAVQNLKNLQKLEIHGTGIETLPSWIWDIKTPLIVVISKEMMKLIPQGSNIPSTLTFQVPEEKTDPTQVLKEKTDPTQVLEEKTDPTQVLEEKTDPTQKSDKTEPAPSSKKGSFWQHKWSGIGIILVGLVGLAAFAWKKWGREFFVRQMQPR